MEGAEDMNIPPRIAIGIIILFHIVGLVGLSLPATKPLFLQIVPFHLLLMLGVIVFSHHKLNSSFGIFILLIFWLGFLAEWIGVNKGWLFGSYAYDTTLGVKLSGIPLMIGVNWFLLIYATGVAMQRSRLKSPFFRVITGAAVLVLLDLLIEPIAIKFDYWHWNSPRIPLENYICWFLVSMVMLYIFEQFRFKKQSIAAPALLVTEFVFFGLLNLVVILL
ncbi:MULTISPECIES: carotenoid biosynthesis protein [unclassified Mucilaginibacter]|uniref:carotenoid biosynthesis protein n=1 Tax=unclassified Mucilaginibacter TaxID=2617802 RepID=UPI002AC95351|nr:MULTISPECIES: carotenoid biosynthesis protein [unclassified Mucilaginibacter]MEB0261065.1 carotenoid biosynthesis protein [Mucilaginibacter sp. 10I4]MEB0278738.1 carotenoid biosynthesis protein [Mucilaginibacter sp. 10B2]MEB0301728.1 carotenoid biosynthesis protein [Mucilaginibacter sp. 5C4]WPX23310.1 carotenoid biosynthesis protein [Mucilaginibacter sp. 5C4]